MDANLSKLDEYLTDEGVDGYLVNASAENATQRYLSDFSAPDPFTTLYTANKETYLLVSGLEYGRAQTEARGSAERPSDYDAMAKAETYGQAEGRHRVTAEWLVDKGVDTVATPSRFPIEMADGLRAIGIGVTADSEDIAGQVRASKTETEITHIQAAQQANEKAMATAERLFGEAESDVDGVLHYDDNVLTSEAVQQEIEVTLLREGYALDETIVACGSQAADPHQRGHGPLYENEAIIVDIFPRSKETGYYADMTRTFCVGEPSDKIVEWYQLTEAALDAALAEVQAGVAGSMAHDAACDVYEAAGYPTLRADESAETGFIHSTGHGVGLDIHEYPRLSTQGADLEAGMVVTVEPGLYDPEIGGVRIEDLVVVREDGYENLTTYERSLGV
jgi:Xaa-Pro aminopeptidase